MKTNTNTHTHTPGPWYYAIEEQGRIVIRSSTTGLPWVAETLSTNARLIAAAPELLAAMEGAEASLTAILCSRVIDSTTAPFFALRRDRDAIRAAIARAEGCDAE